MNKKNEQENKNNKYFKTVFIFFSIIIVFCLCFLIYFAYESKSRKETDNNLLNTIEIDLNNITDNKTERILKLEELQKENDEVIGWLEIKDTNINYPVVQAKDNDFYLTHNYKKEYSSTGSLFLDKDFDIQNGSSNFLIYGHRSLQGVMFEDLLKYSNTEFYNEHKKIRFTTNKEDCLYEVLAVFYSKVYYKSDKNVFRYYYFVNANTEEEFDDFVKNAKKASIYNTGVDASYGDQLLTLSTCEYSQEDGRFAVVLKKTEQFHEE